MKKIRWIDQEFKGDVGFAVSKPYQYKMIENMRRADVIRRQKVLDRSIEQFLANGGVIKKVVSV